MKFPVKNPYSHATKEVSNSNHNLTQTHFS